MPKVPVSFSVIVVATKSQVSADLDGEAVILDLPTGTYYGLNAVGAWIWNLIQEPKPVESIYRAMLDEYDVEPQSCRSDLLALLQALSEAGLIEVLSAHAH